MTRPLVVVGDALLDVDVVARAQRLCPDAPVPVLDDPVEHPRPGGAALAAMLAARTGERPVVLVAAVGDDAEGQQLTELLAAHGVELVVVPADGRTPVKRRLRASGQSVARLDTGGLDLTGDWPAEADAALASAAAVLVSDYGRGVAGLAARAMGATTGSVSRRPVVWDPHPRGGAPLAGSQLVTPNLAEARHFAGRTGTDAADGGRGDALRSAAGLAAGLVEDWRTAAVAVTLGARGALLSQGSGAPAVFPAPPLASGDPCGAGDCFAATAALALAGGSVLSEAVQAAVRAAAAFVGAGGAAGLGDLGPSAPAKAARDLGVPRDHAAALVERVRATGGTVVATGGCFDLLHAGHVATLDAARSLGDCLVVCLNSDDSVRRLKGDPRPLSPQADRARVLEALGSVDAVAVFEEDTPTEVLGRLRPDIWVKGGDYAGADLPEADLLAGWGGQVVVVPYLDGRSTTRLVEAAGAGSGSTR